MKFLQFIIIFGFVGCSHDSYREPNAFIQTAVTSIPLYNNGWIIQGFGGGGTPEGSAYTFILQLKGKPQAKALSEFESLLHEQLSKTGYSIVSEGGGPSSPFTICVTAKSRYFLGSVTVTFTQTARDLLTGTVVTAAIRR